MNFKEIKTIKFKIIQIFLALAVLVIGCYFIKDNYFKKQNLNLAKEAEAEVKTQSSVETEIIDPTNTVKSIENYLKNFTSEYGYSVIDLTSNKTFGARQKNRYFMASTYKIAVSVYLYHQIEQDKVNPEKKLIYNKKFYEEGSGILYKEKPGQAYAINYLNELMIKKSDNVAANILMNYLGSQNIQNYLESNNIKGINIYKNTTTPRAMSLLLQKIYQHKIISENSANKLTYLMINSVNDNCLIAGIAPNVVTAHKIGTYEDAINDVGIVYLFDHPYVISIYSKNNQRPEIADLILASISKRIFEFENSL